MKFPPVFAIAEKPSQATSYASALNAKLYDFYYLVSPCKLFPNGLVIFSAVGHLLELKEPHTYEGFEHLKDWSPDNIPFKIPKPYKYEPIKKTEKTLLQIKDAIREIISQHGAKNVTAISSCDVDVEGSAIFHNALKFCVSEEEYSQLTIKRLWAKSYENKEVFKAFHNLTDSIKDQNMYTQGITRGAADWLVGLSTTRILTIYVTSILEVLLNKRRTENGGTAITVKDILGGTSIRSGRIILPVLHLIYNRHNEINNFIEEKFYEIHANFGVAEGTYKGKLEGFKTFNQRDVSDVLRRHQISANSQINGQVTSLNKEIKHSSSPRLHSILTLQAYANKKWKLTAKNTLKTVQSLYENHKLLTYPRSDCHFIGNSEFEYLLENLDAYKAAANFQFENANCEPRKRYVDPSRVEEHFAIIPTRRVPTNEQLQKLSQNEYRIYMEVMRTTLAMFAPDYAYEQTTVITNINGLDFKTTGKIEKNIGFKILWEDDSNSENNDEEGGTKLPNIFEGEVANAKIEIKTGITKPPEYYTEASLLSAMKTAGQYVDDQDDAAILKEIEGIGTGATRDGAIESLKEANYIMIVKNKIHPTAKAFIACKATEGTLLSSPTMTAKWEKYLKQIGEGTKNAENFLTSVDKFIEQFLKTIPDIISRSETINFFNQLIDRVEENNKSLTCPKCKQGFIKEVNSPKGKFYGCSNFRNSDIQCKFNLPEDYRNRKLSLANIKALLEKGKTPVLKFKNNEDKEYTGRIILDSNTFKLSLEFDNKNKNKK
ncbi:DNA topoisomerase [Lysinibacillus xylanilyticus]|uniref:type IA DNA topoisomerase n=1 Tax=Lysinibacillus xylanilyticus TaxID=582475 RepID=UPI00382D11DD